MNNKNLDAIHYRNHSATQYTLNHELLRKVHFDGSESIIDVGCGDGRITAELAQVLPQGNVLGIDNSASMIDLAIQSFPKESYHNLEFKKISAEEMQMQNIADIVLVLNTLHWIRDPWKALQNVTTALKPGGRLFILAYPKESPYWLFLEETIKAPEWKVYQEHSAYTTIKTTQEYIDALTNLGMKIDNSSVEEMMAIYPTTLDLCNYVKGWLACYLSLSPQEERSFLASAMRQAPLFSLHGSNEEIRLPYTKLTIHAHKKMV